MKETDLAAAIVRYLTDLDWDVHQEVGEAYGPRADIVALRGSLIYVIESKVTLGLSVIAQARHWLDRAHYVSVAVPMRRSANTRDERYVAERILKEWGIGCLEASVSTYEWETTRVEEVVAPRLHRRIAMDRATRLKEHLNDGTRTFAAAGNAEGKFWSPFKQTVAEIHRALRDAGCDLTTRELVDRIKHHYHCDATARNVLPRWLDQGKIPGVEAVTTTRPLRWHLRKDTATVVRV